MDRSEKTNAMRILESRGERYEPFYLDPLPADGKETAKMLGADPATVFKTLVTVGSDLDHYVFAIPVEETLDLKKAARAAGVKSVEMLPQKALFPLTGYVHGGCSPIGMKKAFKTFFDETAILYDEVITSAGKLGVFLRTSPAAFECVAGIAYADLVR